VLAGRRKLLGPDHPDTVLSMAVLAAAYQQPGSWWEKALPLLEQAVPRLKARLGASHPTTRTAVSNLAATYRALRRWDKAAEISAELGQWDKAVAEYDKAITVLPGPPLQNALAWLLATC